MKPNKRTCPYAGFRRFRFLQAGAGRGWPPRAASALSTAPGIAQDPHRPDHVAELDLVEHVEALAQLAEQRVSAVEMRRLAVGHEDLAASAVGVVVPRHAQRSAGELARRELAAQGLVAPRLSA